MFALVQQYSNFRESLKTISLEGCDPFNSGHACETAGPPFPDDGGSLRYQATATATATAIDTAFAGVVESSDAISMQTATTWVFKRYVPFQCACGRACDAC
eukprot:2512651-Rhodomonas_salina.2